MVDTKKGEAAAIVIDTWLQPAGLRSRKISFKSKVSHSSEYPRAAVLRLLKRMLKVLTSSLLQHLKLETQCRTLSIF